MNPITIRNLGPEDAHILDNVRDGTFDNPVDPTFAWAFLATRVNEIVVALEGGQVVGFVSGTVIMHPDKPKGFFVNEVSVHPDFQRQGIARRLMRRMSELARDRRCVTTWVLTEDDNKPARALYRDLDGSETTGVVMYDWDDT